MTAAMLSNFSKCWLKIKFRYVAAELADIINRENVTNHPVLRKRPVPGVETLFVNAVSTEAISELAADESDAVLCHL